MIVKRKLNLTSLLVKLILELIDWQVKNDNKNIYKEICDSY